MLAAKLKMIEAVAAKTEMVRLWTNDAGEKMIVLGDELTVR